MKTPPLIRLRALGSASLAVVLSLTVASTSQAKDKGHGNNGKHGSPGPKHEQKFEHKFEPKIMKKFEQKVMPKAPHYNEHNKIVYMQHPRSGYVLSPGMGYAGHGFYYGPPNSPYYYENPNVKFYPTRESFPRGYAYQRNSQYADELAVQQALARLGYYQGPIDGRIGPQTLNAIGRYQQDHGMGVTNSIVPALLQALGLQ